MSYIFLEDMALFEPLSVNLLIHCLSIDSLKELFKTTKNRMERNKWKKLLELGGENGGLM